MLNGERIHPDLRKTLMRLSAMYMNRALSSRGFMKNFLNVAYFRPFRTFQFSRRIERVSRQRSQHQASRHTQRRRWGRVGGSIEAKLHSTTGVLLPAKNAAHITGMRWKTNKRLRELASARPGAAQDTPSRYLGSVSYVISVRQKKIVKIGLISDKLFQIFIISCNLTEFESAGMWSHSRNALKPFKGVGGGTVFPAFSIFGFTIALTIYLRWETPTAGRGRNKIHLSSTTQHVRAKSSGT